MSLQHPTATARVIQNLALRKQIAYEPTATDRLANDITRLAGDDVDFDPIEQMLIALQSTFMGFATIVAGITVRVDTLGITSIVRALNLRSNAKSTLIMSSFRLALSLRDCSSISPSLLPSSFGTRSAPGSEPFVPASPHRSSSLQTRCARRFPNFS
jgi:hypothetical protein